MHSQNLVKVGQTRLNLIDDPKIRIQILIIGIEEYGDIYWLVKFDNNWMVILREHNNTCPSRAILRFEI